MQKLLHRAKVYFAEVIEMSMLLAASVGGQWFGCHLLNGFGNRLFGWCVHTRWDWPGIRPYADPENCPKCHFDAREWYPRSYHHERMEAKDAEIERLETVLENMGRACTTANGGATHEYAVNCVSGHATRRNIA